MSCCNTYIRCWLGGQSEEGEQGGVNTTIAGNSRKRTPTHIAAASPTQLLVGFHTHDQVSRRGGVCGCDAPILHEFCQGWQGYTRQQARNCRRCILQVLLPADDATTTGWLCVLVVCVSSHEAGVARGAERARTQQSDLSVGTAGARYA